jgi:glycosyltransferase involved in cell wall biosynthesis
MATRILLVNSHGADESVGGAEHYVAELARGLPGCGFEVEILSSFPTPGAPAPTTTRHSTDWRRDRVRRLRNHAGDVVSRPTRALSEAVLSARPDLVNTHNLPGISTAVWEVSRRAGIPVVHSLHDYHLLCPRVTLFSRDGEPCRPHPLLCGARSRRLGRWAGAVSWVTAVSQHLLDRHAEFFSSARGRVIRHPITRPESRPLAPPGGRLRTIGYIGSLEREKGVDRLLEAAPGLQRLGCKLRIAGDGRLRAEVEAAADGSEAVKYVGVVRDEPKAAFFEACDAGIVPSVWEEPGAPAWTVLEWLWAERPVFMSLRGGLGEAAPMLSGLIAIEPTAPDIVAAVERHREAEVWRKAVQRVKPVPVEHDAERWLAEHEDVFRAALGGSP